MEQLSKQKSEKPSLLRLLSVLQSTKDGFFVWKTITYNIGAICLTGTANLSGASEFTPGSK
jgi:hypothetical protein